VNDAYLTVHVTNCNYIFRVFSIFRGHKPLVIFMPIPLEFSNKLFVLSYNTINLLKKERFVDVNKNFISVS
jgi:hypothetical protein